MKQLIYLLLLSLLGIACKETSSTHFEGYYDTTIGAASSPGRHITLTIEQNHIAYFSVDYLNSSPEFIDTCSWRILKNGKLEVKSPYETFRFEKKDNQLIGGGLDYGMLTLIEKDKPAPQSKKLLAIVKKEEGVLFISFGKVPVWEKPTFTIQNLSLNEGDILQVWIMRIPTSMGYEYKYLETLEDE